MISFGLYCDLINDAAERAEEKKVFSAFSLMFAEENNEGEEAFESLIAHCDGDTVRKLMNYFAPDAPVQKQLEKRLAELEAEKRERDVLDEEDVSEYLEKTRIRPRFFDYLVNEIEAHGYTVPDFYYYIGMLRQTFNKIGKQDKISREHALLMAVALEYDYDGACEFLEKAGYSFRFSDRRESFIAYVMRNNEYTLNSIDNMLYFMGEKTLKASK